jgi:hypothetical protein
MLVFASPARDTNRGLWSASSTTRFMASSALGQPELPIDEKAAVHRSADGGSLLDEPVAKCLEPLAAIGRPSDTPASSLVLDT